MIKPFLMKSLFLLLFTIAFSSCTYNFYSSNATTEIFSDEKMVTSVGSLEPNEVVVVKGDKKKKVKVRTKSGYAWINLEAFNYQGKAAKADYVNYSSASSSVKRSSSPSSGGPVQVKGYYRKNGTYVKPHTRSAPRRRT